MAPPSPDRDSRQTYHQGEKWRHAALALGWLAGGGAMYWLFFRWRPHRIEVDGPSMRPALQPGDWALAVASRRARHGDVLVVEHPERPGFEVVKRVMAMPGALAPGGRQLAPRELWVEGDDPASSTDSRHFGPIRREHVRARVWLVYWPPGRWRFLRRTGPARSPDRGART